MVSPFTSNKSQKKSVSRYSLDLDISDKMMGRYVANYLKMVENVFQGPTR